GPDLLVRRRGAGRIDAHALLHGHTAAGWTRAGGGHIEVATSQPSRATTKPPSTPTTPTACCAPTPTGCRVPRSLSVMNSTRAAPPPDRTCSDRDRIASSASITSG